MMHFLSFRERSNLGVAQLVKGCISCAMILMVGCTINEGSEDVAGGTVTETRIHGSITSVEGERVSSAKVALLSLDDSSVQQSGLLRSLFRRENILAETEVVNGEYEFKGYPSGRYAVRAIQNKELGGLIQDIDLSENQEVQVDIILNLTMTQVEIEIDDPINIEGLWSDDLMSSIETEAIGVYAILTVEGQELEISVKVSGVQYEYSLIPQDIGWLITAPSDAPTSIEIKNADSEPINLDSNLASWFPFDGEAIDMSENINIGIVHGAIPISDRDGNPEGAMYFDGIDDWIEVANAVDMKISMPMTLSIWLNPLGDSYPIFTNDGQNDAVYEGVWLSANPDQLEIAYGDSHSGSAGRVSMYSPNAIVNGEWNHLVVVLRGENNADFWINGIKQVSELNQTGTGGAMVYSESPARFGSHYDIGTVTYWFAGSMDDFRMYDIELSEEQIQGLYLN